MNPIDVAHLTFRPPFAPGSYNRLVGMQLEGITGLRQAAISYWDGPVAHSDPKLHLVSGRTLTLGERAMLKLPARLLERRFNGITDRKSLAYLWEALKILRAIRPGLIVCYDTYKFGPLLRRAIDWPCRLVFSQHGLSYQLSPNGAGRLYSFDSFDAVWSLTRAAYRHERYRVSAYEPLVTVLPNWIDTNQFKPATADAKRGLRARWGLPDETLVVLWLSRLVPKKGAHAVLESWPRIRQAMPNAFLWIVGGGDPKYDAYLRRIIENLGVADSVRMQGAVAPDDVVFCHQAADLYVFPTLFSGEGFGLSLLEAMACGLPCIASDHVVLKELYPGDVLAIVPDANLAGAFAAPIVTLLGDLALRERMGGAAREFVVERFHHEKALAAVEEFYREQLTLAGAKR